MRKLKAVLIVVLLFAIMYCISWGQMYVNSQKYYKSAMENYANRDYAVAIKGEKVENEDESGYKYVGGFEEAANIWDSSFAWPKPKVYFDSKNKINEIINKKIDIKTGMELYKRYFQIDKGYLSNVLLRVTDLYIDSDDKEDAKDTIDLIKQSFPNDSETLKLADEKLEKIK